MSLKVASKEKGLIKKSIDLIKKGKLQSDSEDDLNQDDHLNFRNTPINYKNNLEMCNYLTSEHA